MALSLVEIKKLIRLMKKEGVLYLKTTEIELNLDKSAIPQPRLAPESEALETQNKYSEEQVMFYSAPGYDGADGGVSP